MAARDWSDCAPRDQEIRRIAQQGAHFCDGYGRCNECRDQQAWCYAACELLDYEHGCADRRIEGNSQSGTGASRIDHTLVGRISKKQSRPKGAQCRAHLDGRPFATESTARPDRKNATDELDGNHSPCRGLGFATDDRLDTLYAAPGSDGRKADHEVSRQARARCGAEDRYEPSRLRPLMRPLQDLGPDHFGALEAEPESCPHDAYQHPGEQAAQAQAQERRKPFDHRCFAAPCRAAGIFSPIRSLNPPQEAARCCPLEPAGSWPIEAADARSLAAAQ